MKSNLFGKLLLVCLSASLAFGCQNQTVSSSSNNTNSLPTNPTNTNQTKVETKISAPPTIKFESADKVEIVGTFYESSKENSSAVLLLHQWQSSRKSYDAFAKQLQEKGFGVLAIDGRGFGESVKTTRRQNGFAESDG